MSETTVPAPAKSTVKRAVWVAVSLLVVLAIAAILTCTPVLDVLFFDMEFDSQAWRAGNVRLRGRMARDLVSSGQLVNRTATEVVELLGPPDRSYGGSTLCYRVDIGYRGITQPIIYLVVIGYDFKGSDDRVDFVALNCEE